MVSAEQATSDGWATTMLCDVCCVDQQLMVVFMWITVRYVPFNDERTCAVGRPIACCDTVLRNDTFSYLDLFSRRTDKNDVLAYLLFTLSLTVF